MKRVFLRMGMMPVGQGTDNDCDKKIVELARGKMVF